MPTVLVNSLEPGARLPAAVERAAYFVGSEALANVAKHSGASRSEVRLRREIARTGGAATVDRLIVEVWDDGGAGDGPDAMARILRDGRVLVWIGFATAAGFVLAGRDTLTSSVDSLFEEDRRNWVRRVLLERESSSRDPGVESVPAALGR